jgi:hypothetical protein
MLGFGFSAKDRRVIPRPKIKLLLLLLQSFIPGSWPVRSSTAFLYSLIDIVAPCLPWSVYASSSPTPRYFRVFCFV